MTINEFPEDNDLILLANSVYRLLRKKVIRKDRMTKKMTKLLQSRFKITITKVIDEYDNRNELHLVFWEDKITDSVSPKIRTEIFKYVKPDPKIYPMGTPEDERIYYHHQEFYQFMYIDYDLQGPHPDFVFSIPLFLLNATHDYLTNYIMDRYLLADKFDGMEFQKKIGATRVLSLDDQMKLKLTNQISKLKSKGNNTHEKNKGKIISECFNLLGFETLCIDVLKGTKRFHRLNELRDVDVIAFSFATQSLILIEEKRKFTKKDWYKLDSLPLLLKVFPFLGRAEQWRVTYLVVASATQQIRNELTEVVKDKNIVFWDLKTFKSHFLPFFDKNLKISQGGAWMVVNQERRPIYFNQIFLKLMKMLIGDAKRPIFQYKVD